MFCVILPDGFNLYLNFIKDFFCITINATLSICKQAWNPNYNIAFLKILEQRSYTMRLVLINHNYINSIDCSQNIFCVICNFNPFITNKVNLLS